MKSKAAREYVEKLNGEKYAGHSDWRLPTLEELTSLLEPEEKDGLYIDPVFDRNQRYCWTSDRKDGWSGPAWLVSFNYGGVNWSSLVFNNYVRCVCRDNDG